MTTLQKRESATGESSPDETTDGKTAATKATTAVATKPVSIKTSPRKGVSEGQTSKGKDSKRAKPKVRGWQKLGKAIARHPRITTTALLLALASGTGIVLLCLLFKGAWSGHQDNVGILHTLLKMELAREDTLAINDDDTQQVITRTYLTLEPYVAQDDWTWINRFGSTITYGKQDQRLIASCSAYSPLYLICDLSEIP